MNPFGIADQSYRLLLEAFVRHPQIEEVVLFGSRAKGNYRKGSDIDLALKGRECSANLALTLRSHFNEELPIPYMVDIVDYQSLNHRELIEHIDRAGVVFYRRELKP